MVMNQRAEHGGNIYKIGSANTSVECIDFSANINPLGPPEWLRSVVNRELENIVHYPDPDCTAFCKAAADHHGLQPTNIVVGNGTAELLYAILRVFKISRILIPVPSYVDYYHAAQQSGHEVVPLFLLEEENFQLNCGNLAQQTKAGDIVIIGTPNNPTGVLPDSIELKNLISAQPKSWFILDEAFLDFIPNATSLAGSFPNVITLNSMTKFYALPGLRVGYCTCPVSFQEKIREILPPWSVNSLAQAVGVRAFKDKQYQIQTVQYVQQVRAGFYQRIQALSGVKVIPSVVNYHLCSLTNGMDCFTVRDKLLGKGIIIRPCENFIGLDDRFIRIAVRTEKENASFFSALNEVLGQKNGIHKIKRIKKTPSLMLQGTCSNAGKSILASALCRILWQDGVSVAPFKAQNMSLNSFVTIDGGEMGRAQVVQAQAAKIAPDWRMNPILLKPNSDIGSQVIVEGQPVGNMSVGEYHRYKNTAWTKVCRSYDELSYEYQAIILEGAGSPGEVNLKQHDIVNMRMAQYAEAPVLLVGDIDRGGVYASFVGIMDVLAEWERKCIAGFIVNRFRGDVELLEPAHDYIRDFTGREVLGVVPYIKNLGIPEEDSVSFKGGGFEREQPTCDHVVICLVNLPHISNFTDFEPFLDEPDVYLKIISTPEELSGSHAVLLPGSKNVLADLQFLQDQGFFSGIQKFTAAGGTVVGVCGGYQMLGKKVSDPYGIESKVLSALGLQLLDIETEILLNKKLIRKGGFHNESGCEVSGYEIHHGVSQGDGHALFTFTDTTRCGHSSLDGQVWGVYLHGLFDSDSFRRWFIDQLREKAGYGAVGQIVYRYDLEKSFETLATTVRSSLDMDTVYKLLGL